MGNTESTVTSGVKAQANSVINMYSLVDVNGGGELVELMKKATKTKDYNELDETIRSKIAKYVYPGPGRNLPIHHFVIRRNKERPPAKQLTIPKMLPADESVAGKYVPGKDDPSKVTDFKTYRFQCWDLDLIGAVGETPLHLCVLNATSVHNDLAKRIIRHYPETINDCYLCDEYYGENVLHIAIVNEDPSMVKFLLDNGANYNERCIGNFMSVEDQKPSRQDSLDHEWVDLCLTTNYKGYIYWGEYPLSFAACLGQGECYRLILAKGANPDNEDTNGNTVAHMMVIYDKMDMFDMCFELGASIDVVNRQGLTPLTLAAILARRDLFFHILNIQREIYWQIGNVTCAAYPLERLDTINPKNGETDKKSALNLIAYGEKEAHLDLMEGPIVDLLKTKWETFVKFRFYRLFFIFLTYFLISMMAYVLRPVPCVAPGTKTSSQKNLSIMTFPSLGIQCVNISVALSPKVTVIDETNTNDPMLFEFMPNSRKDPFVARDLLPSMSNETTTNTADPNFLDEDIPLGSLNVEDNVLTASVTELPQELFTLQYSFEGSEVSVTLANDIYEYLNLTNTERPQITTDSTTIGTTEPFSLTCYNRSHNLLLTGRNRTLFISRVYKRHPYSKEPIAATVADPWAGNQNKSDNSKYKACNCYLWKKPKPSKEDEWYILGISGTEYAFYVRVISEGMTLVGSLAYLIGAAREARFQGLQMFFENLSTVPSRVLFLLACCFVVIMAGLRVTCQTEAENIVAILAMVCTGPYFLFFCRGFKAVGPMVTMIYTMLAGDLLRFVTIYFVFIMGFSQAYYVVFGSYMMSSTKTHCVSNPLLSPVESIIQMFIMSLGNFGDLYASIECTDHDISGKVLFLSFMAIVCLLLINLLIAMMGNTYQRIAEMKNEWMRQWARIVLVVERGLSPEVRLEKLMDYSQPMSDGTRALVLRLHQDEEEREEMKDIFDMKRVHRRYVDRRLKKYADMQKGQSTTDMFDQMATF